MARRRKAKGQAGGPTPEGAGTPASVGQAPIEVRVDGKTHHVTVCVPLRTTPRDERILKNKFRVLAFYENSCKGKVGEMLDRLRESRAWRRAKAMPDRTPEERMARAAAFQNARNAAGFQEKRFTDWAKDARNAF
jgi:hypothetical protein